MRPQPWPLRRTTRRTHSSDSRGWRQRRHRRQAGRRKSDDDEKSDDTKDDDEKSGDGGDDEKSDDTKDDDEKSGDGGDDEKSDDTKDDDEKSGDGGDDEKSDDTKDDDEKSGDGGDDEKSDDTTDDEKSDDGDDDDDEAHFGIEFVDPASGTYVEVGEVRVRGFVNQRSKVTVNHNAAEVGLEGHWSAVVDLEPGKNVLVARAENEAGHVAEDELVIYWDREEPPARLGIEVTSPRSGSETEREAIRIEGFVTAPAKVVVGDWRAEVSDSGKWWVVLPLRAGKNHFVAKATASNGSTASDEVVIYRITDNNELGIEITNLKNEQRVDDAEIKVKGVVSRGATVTVNGKKGQRER